MKKFLLQLTCFILLIVVVLSIIAYGTDRGLTNTRKGRMQVWNEITQDSINAEVIILGNSHARVQVNPDILSINPGNAKAYNLGLDGYAFDMQLARYHLYRSHNRAPKLIVQCIDLFEFDRSTWGVDKVQFLPFLRDSAINSSLISLGMPWWHRYAPFLKYRSEANTVFAALCGLSALPNDDKQMIRRGYKPVDLHWNERAFQRSLDSDRHYAPKIDSNVWTSFLQFADECKRSGIVLCLVFTPHSSRFLDRAKGVDAYVQRIREATWHNAHFFNFLRHPITRDTAMFFNGTHLNAKGADLFTKALADSLRGIASPGTISN